jgi:hypothetical protein
MQSKGVVGRLNNHISGDLAAIVSAQATLINLVAGPFGVVLCATLLLWLIFCSGS